MQADRRDDAMNSPGRQQQFSEQYISAFEASFLPSLLPPDDGTATAAAALAREAAARGVNPLEMIAIHHQALFSLWSSGALQSANAAAQAARFLAECLVPLAGDDRTGPEVRRAGERADAATRELEAFTYSIAHDLRAPLRSIEGFALALFEDCAGQLDEQGMSHLGYVRQSAHRLSQMIDDLLALSRLSRGELHRAPIDVTALAGRVLDDFGEGDPGRAVSTVVRPQMSAIADESLVRTILEHLIGNAWKFTAGRHDPRIECGMIDGGDPPVYFVSDNGSGFDMTYAERLFGAFQRLHPAEQFAGRGIGLAAVQRIVRRHGGRVWADAAPNQGARFFFTLEEESEG